MSSGKALFLSQGDETFDRVPARDTPRETPREGHFRHHNEPNCLNSPNPKKKRGRFAGRGGAADFDEVENSVFNFCSQDSNMGSNLSQFSQDFTDRLGSLTMKASQDQFSNCNSNIAGSDDSALSGDCFSIASVPINNNSNLGATRAGSSSVRSLLSLTNPTLSLIQPLASSAGSGAATGAIAAASVAASNQNQRPIETERKITIGPAIDNQFLPMSSKPPPGKSQDLFIAPFKERPRTIVDFEHISDIGEGVSSIVSCVRRRLDGALYAVKRIKMKINSIGEGKMYIREVCAHAALAGCPYMTRYFGCWIDGGHLHIQNEYCEFGSIESFVSSQLNDYGDRRGSNKMLMPHGSGSQMWDDSGGEESLLSFPTRPGTGYELDRFSQTTDSAENSRGGMPRSVDDSGTMKESGSDAEPVGISDDIAWLTLHQVGSAIAYMHERGMVHLDIRPANVFIKACCNTDELISLALADGIAASGPANGSSTAAPVSVFSAALGLNKAPTGRSGKTTVVGSSFGVGRSRSSSCAVDGNADPSSATQSHTQSIFTLKPTPEQLSEWLRNGWCELRLGDLGHTCKADERVITEGEPRYCARELLNNSEDDLDLYSADVFSLGASIYELCLGRELGRGPEGVMEWHMIRDGTLDSAALENRDPKLVELLRQMLHNDPAHRPRAAEVVSVAADALRALASSQCASSYPSATAAANATDCGAGVGTRTGTGGVRAPLAPLSPNTESPLRTHAPTHELAVMASELARLKRENESLKNQLKAVSGLHADGYGDDENSVAESLSFHHKQPRLHATDSSARLMDFNNA